MLGQPNTFQTAGNGDIMHEYNHLGSHCIHTQDKYLEHRNTKDETRRRNALNDNNKINKINLEKGNLSMEW